MASPLMRRLVKRRPGPKAGTAVATGAVSKKKRRARRRRLKKTARSKAKNGAEYKADISNNSELGEGVDGSGSDSDPSGNNMDQAKVAMHLGVSVRASGQDLVRRIRDH